MQYKTQSQGNSATVANSPGSRGRNTTAGKSTGDRARVSAKILPAFAKRVTKKDLVNLVAQLSIMSRSGVDISSALQSMARQTQHPTLKIVLADVVECVHSGNALSDALSQYPRIFNETFVATVAAGEASGRLADVLQQLATLMRGELGLHNSIRAMLAYPILLTFVCSVVLLALVLFVLPKFAAIFSDFDAPLPIITQILVGLSSELRTRFWLWLPLACSIPLGAWMFSKSVGGRVMIDRSMLYMPVVRDVTRTLLIGRACRLLGLMLESGVP